MDQGPLEIIYIHYRREILLYLYGLSGDMQLSEDLTQDAFLKAFLTLPNDGAGIRAWLYRVARNLLIDHLRRKEHQNLSFEDAESIFQGKSTLRSSGSSSQSLADPGSPDPLEQLIEDEDRQQMYLALEELEPRQREVLLLQYYARLPQREIASLLGMTCENVRVLAYRGKRTLQNKRRRNPS